MPKVKVVDILRILAREKAYREVASEIIAEVDSNKDVESLRKSYISNLVVRAKLYEERLICNYEKYFGQVCQLIFQGDFTTKVSKEGVPVEYLIAEYSDIDGSLFLLFHHYYTKEEAEDGIEKLLKDTPLSSLQDLYVVERGKMIKDFVLAVDKSNLSAKVRWLE